MTLLTSMLLNGMEKTVNQLLDRDPAAAERLNALAGLRMLVCLERPAVNVRLSFDPRGIHLASLRNIQEKDADIIVELTLETLASLLGGADVRQLMFSGRLAARGQIARLETVRELFMDLDIDWEGALVEWFGEVPAHSLATGLRRVGHFGLHSRDALTRDLQEYMQEEAQIIAGQSQTRVAREHLTNLQVAVDRLEARMNLMQHRLLDEDAS
ncbi:ubiquinone biosynthesis accessory factor UbiJ [Larsenimonas rhizosphaerae]|uniref:Ubiquinone biosynthesis accessory factor UbiJ n=1 Tax=Larsenimonas rhizosphaerae TaxID=2944682 RepID=A0AA41ZM47_9GAMM|nr:SCP2 sterol-binding domain-containing protein [Larsenimonas rhizosphaerae]MCM2129694.1 SCP2 sterol-binding domain-containing protein [Larsenimonas rhizosphaerae]MCX2524353.1 SCP2 sterol-binding domain-containing protein [Larsenimonas rhizosphaerae]